MLQDIVFANPLDDHRLHIRYEDGVEGVINPGAIVSFRGVFAPLKDPACFSQVQVDAELGTVICEAAKKVREAINGME